MQVRGCIIPIWFFGRLERSFQLQIDARQISTGRFASFARRALIGVVNVLTSRDGRSIQKATARGC